jgi:two-component system, NarL family, sensor kinase
LAYRRGYLKKVMEYVSISIPKAEKGLADPNNKRFGFERILYMGLNLMGVVHSANAFNRNNQMINKYEFDKAHHYFRRCLVLCKQYSSLEHNLPTIYHNISRYFKDTHQSNDSTLYYLNEEIKSAKRLGQEIDLIGAYYMQAEIFFDKGQYTAAEKILMEAYTLTQKYQDPDHLVIVPHLLAKVYLKTARYKEAEVLAKNALQLAESKGILDDARYLTETLTAIYTAQKDDKNTLLYTQKLIILKDSIYNQEKTQSINEISVKYETKEKEYQITALKKEKSLKNYLIAALLSAFVLSGIAVWNKNKASKLDKIVMQKTALLKKQESEKLQRELTLQSLYLDQRKNILQDVKKYYKTLQSNNQKAINSSKK